MFTCAANASTAVHNHRGASWSPSPTVSQALDCSLPPLKYMLTEVQHSRSTLGHPEVWPADIEVVVNLPSLSRLGKSQDRFVEEGSEILGSYLSTGMYEPVTKSSGQVFLSDYMKL